MDGNNRWSLKNKISKYQAYKIGAKRLINLSNYIFSNTEIKYISAFVLSKNNLKRSAKIINVIKKILYESLVEIKNHKTYFDLVIIGDVEFLDLKTKNMIKTINKKNIFKKKLILYLNYGGKEDIEQAAKSNLYNSVEKNLLSGGFPDPEVLIRTGGFNRLSNFLLYQISFTELFFLKKLWPDLNSTDIKKIISNFRKIKRKFGK